MTDDPPEPPMEAPPNASPVEPEIRDSEPTTVDSEADASASLSPPDAYDSDRWEDAWRRFFPFDEPYPQQAAAVREFITAAEAGGFATIEGPCGTGKTLAALCGALALIHDRRTTYTRVMCLTSKNQQLRAFEDDLRAVNRSLNETSPSAGLTLIGKSSVCSYVDSGDINPDNIYRRCESLRDPIKQATTGSTDQAIGMLKQAVRNAETGIDGSASKLTDADNNSATASWEAPYLDTIPARENDDDAYCPFYARSRLAGLTEDGRDGSLRFHRAPDNVLTPDEIRRLGSDAGLCPHVAMMQTAEEAEVLIGNYYHAFDPETVGTFTTRLIDEQTLVVCDEAHELVGAVRDLLSATVAVSTLREASGQLRRHVLAPIERGDDEATFLKQALRDEGCSYDDINALADALETIAEWAVTRGETALDDNGIDGWRLGSSRPHSHLPDEVEASLGSATEPTVDDLTEYLETEGLREQLTEAARVTSVCMEAVNLAAEMTDSQPPIDIVFPHAGRVIENWLTHDHTAYFRTLSAERRYREQENPDNSAEAHYSLSLNLHNCIPSTEIAERLDQFGGGLLMSATLAPLDVFQDEAGLATLDTPSDDSNAETGRPVRQATYDLRFPAKNRCSAAVDLPKYTYGNRGGYTSDQFASPNRDQLVFNETRAKYANIIETVAATTPGNVLVGMPSYAEADWAASLLQTSDRTDKPVLTDESSSNEWTEELKSEFFSGPGKVLVTSVRGTLTTGVDYDGDKLHGAVICGVPLPNTQGEYPDAIETAYDDAFDRNGFEVAFTIPAVRNARQTLGRVIRSETDTGVRVLADRRYAGDNRWDDVREHLPASVRDEYPSVDPMLFDRHLRTFWTD